MEYRYGRYYTGHTITAESAELPVSLEAVRMQLRMDDLRHDDEYLIMQIKAQCALIEKQYQCALLTKTVVEHHSRFPQYSTNTLFVSGIGPVNSITSIQYYNSAGTLQTWASTEWNFTASSGGANITLKPDYSWPTNLANRPDAVIVTYSAGYGTGPSALPPNITAGILSRIARAYTNREDSREEGMSMSDVLLQPLKRWI